MMDERERSRFSDICEAVVSQGRAEMGIGTYGEKYMHLILKTFFCEDTDWHEVGLGSFVADAVVGNTIYEIQTAGFYPLRKKIAYYLSETKKDIVIVAPVIVKKRLIWVDSETGEAKKPRTTAVRGAWTRVLREIYWLCDMLDFERMRIRLMVMTADEYRKLDGYGTDKKKRATKIEKVPRELIDIIDIASPADAAQTFLPENLTERFTAKDFSALTGAKRLALSSSLHALESLGVICRDGKEGRAAVYRVLVR